MAFSISDQSLFLGLPFALLLVLSITFTFTFAVENQPNNQPNAEGWIYNHTKPPWPGLSERGQLRCIGDWPDLMREFGRRGLIGVHSLLEFCAEPGYGGRLNIHPISPSRNGGFCAWFLEAPRFVMSRRFVSEGISFDWKREVLCQAKCACEWYIVSDVVESRGIVQDRRLAYMPLDHGHAFQFGPTEIPEELPLMDSNLVQHPIPLYLSPHGFTHQFTVDLATGLNLGTGKVVADPTIRLMKKTSVSGHDRNNLTCNEELPSWPLPHNRFYLNTYDLCSASFLGGHPVANAGGLCINAHINLMQFREEFSYPYFSRSLVRYEGYRATAALAVGFWCLTSCTCALPDFKGKPHRPSNKIRGYGEVLKGEDGSLSVQMKGTKTTPGKLITIVTALVPGSASTGQCSKGRDGQTWCFADLAPGELEAPPMRGPTDIFSRPGQRLSQPPPVLDVLPEDTCGNVCEGVQDCDGCLCQVDHLSREMIEESYDPIAGRVMRYATLALCVSASVLTSNAKLGRRGAPSTPLCACNSTYVSTGCCGSTDGIIWESRGQKWGELDM